ncbi:unnamed protein product [Spirodela intermedia]|uniref:Uncharacterized protein n=2 Tax=Spirodela intermedia TaxID=51605 RepID=A0A7I8KMI2_SPIIN|nr:unnamed protein product [Spirodela intermedia]CAA6662113.1 unnamed protein product [Spirodela intermedia]CAA7398496.1 unnamed protein product [Spirodela intermedia]
MDATVEIEGDVFFADLANQIALLIMEEDDAEGFASLNPLISPQGSNLAPKAVSSSPVFYEPFYGREVKGTGVFIPQSSKPRKKHRSRKPRASKAAVSTTGYGNKKDQQSEDRAVAAPSLMTLS